MGYTVLARRYRPQRFADLVGQQVAARALSRAVAEERLAHAYLLAGIRGVGKTTIARILAMAVNCDHSAEGEPCGRCTPCQSIAEGRALDVLEMDAASHTGVDDIRELIESAQYPPAALRKKVFIIDEAHMLSRNAFNALLKTLEEPPEHVLFVLATTEPERVPPTVRSRCQRFDLRKLAVSEIAEHLQAIFAREGISADEPALVHIARAADGSLRDALSIAERVIAFAGRKIDARSVQEALGMIDAQLALALSDALFAGDGAFAVRLLRQAQQQGHAPRAVLVALVELWRALACAIADPALLPEGLSQVEMDWLHARCGAVPRMALDLRLQVLVRALSDLAVIEDALGAEIALLRLAGLAEIDGFSLKQEEKQQEGKSAPPKSEPSLPAAKTDLKEFVAQHDWPALVEAYRAVRPRVAGVLEHAAFTQQGDALIVRLAPGHAIQIDEAERQAFAHWLGMPVRWLDRGDEETVHEQLRKKAEAERAHRMAQAKEDAHVQNLIRIAGATLEDVQPAGKAEDER